MSLRDGTKKMSKSEESDYSRINLKDKPDEIVKKIKKLKQMPRQLLRVWMIIKVDLRL